MGWTQQGFDFSGHLSCRVVQGAVMHLCSQDHFPPGAAAQVCVCEVNRRPSLWYAAWSHRRRGAHEGNVPVGSQNKNKNETTNEFMFASSLICSFHEFKVIN